MLTYLQKIVVILKVIFIFVLNKEIGMLYMYNGINKSVETRIIQELTCFQKFPILFQENWFCDKNQQQREIIHQNQPIPKQYTTLV